MRAKLPDVAKVSVVILAYRSEPWLEKSVHAALASMHVDADVVLVDNGCTDGAVERVRGTPGLTIVEPGRNLGFAGGCNAGAARATGDIVALVNGDAIVEPDALAKLVEVLGDTAVGIATASIRLDHDHDLLNSGGNEIHFLGFSWSGRFLERAGDQDQPGPVTGASGAGMAMRRDLWERLGGFDDEYFAYHEDAELSIRCWQQGLSVVYVPDAVVVHRYEFSRNPRKYYLIERNRLALVLTTFGARALALLAPALLALELATVVLAISQGWVREKVAGWRWLVQHRGWLVARRRQLQQERRRTDRELAYLYAAHLDPANFELPRAVRPLDGLLSAYWGAVRKVL